MKSKLIFVVVIILVMCMAVLLTGCNFAPSTYIANVKTIKPLKYVGTFGDEMKHLKFTSDILSHVDVVFAAPVEMNGIMIVDKNSAALEFQLYDITSGDEELIYAQDYIEGMRICNFNTITTTAIRLRIINAEKPFNITEIKCFLDKAVANDKFFSSGNATVADMANIDKIEIAKLCSLDRITLSDAAEIVISGAISYNANLDAAIENIKSIAAAAGKNIAIVLGHEFVRRGESQENFNSKVVATLNNHGAQYAQVMAGEVERVKAAGIVVDWEYPKTKSEYAAVGEFAIKFKQISKAELIVPIGTGDFNMAKKYMRNIDKFELRAHGVPDSYGNHSGYTLAVDAIDALHKKGVPTSQIILSLPSYGLQTTDINAKIPYVTQALRITTMNNYAPLGDTEIIVDKIHFNAPTLVFDKVRYARAVGIVGICLSDYSYDTEFTHEMSMLATIRRAIDIYK